MKHIVVQIKYKTVSRWVSHDKNHLLDENEKLLSDNYILKKTIKDTFI